MPDKNLFPALGDWQATRDTLHFYSHAVSIVPRAHLEFHPKWWHISLKVQPDGLVTEKMALPDGGQFWFKVDLRQHQVFLITNQDVAREFSIAEGLTSAEFGDQILDAVADLGLTAKYIREKYENDEPRQYDPAAAERFLAALVNADRIFKEHRATLSGDVGPVQLWPHGFDLSFEWFGTRVETYEHDGKVEENPSQLNLGFYPGGTPEDQYFYSNPWPFEADELLGKPLPDGASWHTEGWQGTILPYEELVDDDEAEERLREYALAVFEICSPTLLE
jgi:hypothetical protein